MLKRDAIQAAFPRARIALKTIRTSQKILRSKSLRVHAISRWIVKIVIDSGVERIDVLLHRENHSPLCDLR